MTVTVVQVIKDLGLEPEPRLSWRAGAAIRDLYEAEHGELPEKALRTKTIGVGSHCFAIYPDEWRGRIAEVVSQLDAEERRQMDLFQTRGETT